MVVTDVLQKINSEKFSNLLEITFRYLKEKQKSTQVFTLFKSFCENTNLNFSDVEPVIKVLMETAKGLNEDQVQMFIKQYENTSLSIAQSILAETIPINPLLDMEWKFGVTSASNQVNTIGNVFLQMKLTVDQGNEQTKTVFFELQLPEFYAFLHEMEKARASLEYLS